MPFLINQKRHRSLTLATCDVFTWLVDYAKWTVCLAYAVNWRLMPVAMANSAKMPLANAAAGNPKAKLDDPVGGRSDGGPMAESSGVSVGAMVGSGVAVGANVSVGVGVGAGTMKNTGAARLVSAPSSARLRALKA